MPLTKISAPKHLAQAQVKALAEAVQDGLVKTCNVPPNDLFQLISRFDSDEMILDPHFGGVNRSNDACVVEVVFLLGRTDDQKRALFRHVAEQAIHAGFRADDIMIALVENSRMDWSLGHGVAYADYHSKAQQSE
jgi:phenylpyruvate tautomerase PptA (4-oxalocrotonate tautomerase family)